MFYNIDIKGLKRDLPLCPLNDKLDIAAFVMFGDVELTEHCAQKLVEIVPAHDVIITPESKGIPLVYTMARLLGNNKYIVARKAPKLYMKDIVKCEVKSITTTFTQTLYLDGADAEFMKGKRVLIVDDVISTGESLKAVEALVQQAGGNIVGKAAVLAEDVAANRADIIFLAPLPLFDKKGNPLT